MTNTQIAIDTLRKLNKKDGLGLYIADSLEMGARALENHLLLVNMITRNQNNKLAVDTVALDDYITKLFSECKNDHEVAWLGDLILDTVENIEVDIMSAMHDEEKK